MMKKMKKFLTVFSTCIISCLVMLCTLTFLAGCGDEGGNEGGGGNEPVVIVPKISFTVSEKNLTVGDEEYLFPEYKKTQGYALSYQSSDPSIVSVNSDGKISAESEGSVTVKAVYSNGTNQSEASLTVHSSFSGYLPELKTMGVSNSLSIAVNDSYILSPFVTFNGKDFTDVRVSYSIVNPQVADISANGEITPKSKGDTEIVLNASWRGKDHTSTPTMQKMVSLSVIDNVRFYNNGTAILDEKLYTMSEFEGESYQNTMPCAFTISVNGVESAASIEIENEEIVRQQGNLLVANAFGETKITVFKNVDDTVYSKIFTVKVQRIEKTVEETVPLFSTVDGTWLNLNTKQEKTLLNFIGEENEIVDAYQASKALTVLSGKVMGVESSSQSGRGTADISVGTANVVYHLHLETLAKAISKAEDLKCFELSPGEIIVGYYELVCNVDASSYTMSHSITTSDTSAYFAGVFNGNGYVIDGLNLQENYSIFGVLASTAIVKNVAFTNLNATKAYFFAQNTLDYGLNISNIYIQISEQTQSPRGLFGRMDNSAVFKNVVLEYLGTNAERNRTYEDRWAWQGLMGGMWRTEVEGKIVAQDSKWGKVLVISPFVASFRTDEKINDEWTAVYGYGANETVDIYGNPIGQMNTRPNPNLGANWWTENYVAVQYTNLYHYASYEALKESSFDYSSFSSDYWFIVDGRIAWKSIVEESASLTLYDGNTALGSGYQMAKVDKQFQLKAFVDGKEISDIQVEMAENEYLSWDHDSKQFTCLSLPERGVVEIEVLVKIKLDQGEIIKTFKLTLRSLVVTPVHSGGNFETDDRYDGYYGGKKEPIHSGGNFDAGDNYGD